MASLYRRGTSKIWTVSWHDDDGHRRIRSTGTQDRRRANVRAHQIVANDHKPAKKHQSLEVLVVVWISELESLGRTHNHLTQRQRALKVLGLNVHNANRLMGKNAKEGLWSDQTIRLYYAALRQFGRWCVENGHRDKSPMQGLKRPSRRSGRVYVRGVLTKEQASVLCNHPAIPEHRRLVYKTALSTGLRIGELRKLKQEHLKVINGRHCIHLKPRHVKNRFESVLPISEELYDELQGGLDLLQFSKSAKRLRRDLQVAGLPLKDVEGHPIDFHSLRVTFGSLLVDQGVQIPTVARLMRHSDGGVLLLKKYVGGFIGDDCLFDRHSLLVSDCQSCSSLLFDKNKNNKNKDDPEHLKDVI